MPELKLGQTIAASLTSTDTKNVNPTSPLNGAYYTEYDLSGLDSFRQIKISVQTVGTNNNATLELIDVATGDIIAQTKQSGGSTVALAANYGLRMRVSVTINYR
jgi:hypothetical protein